MNDESVSETSAKQTAKDTIKSQAGLETNICMNLHLYSKSLSEKNQDTKI